MSDTPKRAGEPAAASYEVHLPDDEWAEVLWAEEIFRKHGRRRPDGGINTGTVEMAASVNHDLVSQLVGMPLAVPPGTPVTPTDEPVSAAALAAELGVPAARVRVFLNRFAEDRPWCRVKNPSRRYREPTWLYHRCDVLPALRRHFCR